MVLIFDEKMLIKSSHDAVKTVLILLKKEKGS